ncbi:hypothetical protein DL763_005663 [Monosporascus cannonballus]|nr:hypothetical protein DL763_005663 [Monosporascus cannonballus]
MMRMRKSRDVEKRDNIAAEEIYRDGMRMDLTGFREPTALLDAARTGLEDVVWLLLTRSDVESDQQDRDGRTPLSWAAEMGHEAAVRLLLGRGADPESKDKNDETPLMWAAGNRNEGIVKLLFERGADPKSKDKNGCIPLIWAAWNKNDGIVKLLFERGADP